VNWLAWRQHRKQFMILGIILALYAVLAITMGNHLWHTYQYALSTCGKTDTCSQLNQNLFQTGWSNVLNPTSSDGFPILELLIVIVPFVVGMLIGVPLIAREYNEGTNKLAWTQGVSRRKWLTLKLAWVLIATAIFMGIFALLTTWFSRTGNVLNQDRFTGIFFDIQGITPIGYAIFVVSLVVALGAWLKRILVALGIAFVILAAVSILVPSYVRPHYETPRTYNTSLSASLNGNGSPDSPPTPSGSGAAWVTGGSIVNKQGQQLNWSSPPQKCIVTSVGGNPIPSGHTTAVRTVPGNGTGTPNAITSRNGGPSVGFDCLTSLGYHWRVQYQPAYRYWDFQRIETGLYLVLSVIPLAATYWLVLRRDA
jgi:ABC-type transport system involved in multi-copper enzyme maturation permease subunit